MEQKSKFNTANRSRSSDEEEEEESKDSFPDKPTIPPKFSMPSMSKGTTKKLQDFSPIDSQKFFPNQTLIDNEIPVYWAGDFGISVVCLHGAGHSATSFAPLAGCIEDGIRLISFDFRGHGMNQNENSLDLSENTLINDTIKVLSFIAKKFPEENIIVMGHSMGGSIATKTVAHIIAENTDPLLVTKIQGLIVIDVVEGTAMDALPFMESIVINRPQSFSSVDGAIQYMFKSSTIKNLESARISVPSLVMPKEVNSKTLYIWKTDLLATKQYWEEWFKDLTKSFLSIRIPKVLLLAASDRMDKDLTIAQMQGKFKLSVIRGVGHIIQEDNPKATAEVITDFVKLFKIPVKTADIKPIIGKLGSSSSIPFK